MPMMCLLKTLLPASSVFNAAMYAGTHPNVQSGGIITDGDANAYGYSVQIWRKVHQLRTLVQKKVEMQPLHKERSRPPPRRHDDWSNTRDRAASLAPTTTRKYDARTSKSEQPQRGCPTPYYSRTSSVHSMRQGRDRVRGGGINQVVRGDGGGGGAARKRELASRGLERP